jgi:hypothetical protein
MDVTNIGDATHPVHGVGRHPPPPPTPQPLQPEPPPTESPATQDSQRGVIRLLQEGHFKGVADLRLRINFFHELSAQAVASALPVVRQKATDLAVTVGTQLAGLADTLAVDEQTQQALDAGRAEFEAGVQAANEQFASGGTLNRDSLIQALQSAFGQLFDTVRVALTPAAPQDAATTPATDADAQAGTSAETVTDSPQAAGEIAAALAAGEPVPVDAVGAAVAGLSQLADGAADTTSGATAKEPPDAAAATQTTAETPATNLAGTSTDDALQLDDLFASFRTAFDEALASLSEFITTATRLPDPAPSTGHGRAYDKFLAIYNDLRGLAPPADTGTEDTVDNTA